MKDKYIVIKNLSAHKLAASVSSTFTAKENKKDGDSHEIKKTSLDYVIMGLKIKENCYRKNIERNKKKFDENSIKKSILN